MKVEIYDGTLPGGRFLKIPPVRLDLSYKSQAEDHLEMVKNSLKTPTCNIISLKLHFTS
jgi:hypothetical protein